jgi:membrane protein
MTGKEPPGPHAGPDSPTKLTRRSLWTAVKRTFVEFDQDNAWDWAAALTYYAVLSIFPGLLVLVSLVGLLRKQSIQPLLDSINGVAPGPVRGILTDSIHGLEDHAGKASLVALVGLVVALFSASGYIGAFMRAANAMYDVPEGRPMWKTIPIRIGVTAVVGVLLVVSALIVILSGDLATAVGRGLGLEAATVTLWTILKWPMLVVLVSLMFGLLYRVAPNARQGGLRWITPGGLFAVVLWMLVSVLFGVYASHFASYDATYGTLGGVVVFLVWLWLSNLALLLGAEFDSELERQRAVAAGHPPDEEPYLRLRDDRSIDEDKAVEPGLADRGKR